MYGSEVRQSEDVGLMGS